MDEDVCTLMEKESSASVVRKLFQDMRPRALRLHEREGLCDFLHLLLGGLVNGCDLEYCLNSGINIGLVESLVKSFLNFCNYLASRNPLELGRSDIDDSIQFP